MSTDFIIKAAHPRLSLTPDVIKRCQAHMASDEHTASLAAIVRAYADAFLSVPPIEHTLQGRRLLGPVRASLQRIVYLAFAYKLWGERAHLDRCIKEVEVACALPDWNPSHFLDTAEMATALAYAYDWLFDELSDELKQTIRSSLIEKAIQPGFEPGHFWIGGTNNWVQVCHGGLVLAALAMYEDEPDYFHQLYQRAVELIPKAIEHSYAPDGAYPEGPGYWSYGTSYSSLMYDGLLSALGPDAIQPFMNIPGFLKSAYYRIHMIGPDKFFYSYSDCGVKNKVGVSAPMWWCANQLQDQQLQGLIRQVEQDALPAMQEHIADGAQGEGAVTRIDRWLPFLLMWSQPVAQAAPLGNTYFGNGLNPVCSMRSTWGDDKATWLAAKGGNLEVGHPQMDSGSFVFVSEGQRWVHDLGADKYHKLEVAFGSGTLWAKEAPRFNFMRLSLKAHSTIQINQAQQALNDCLSPITHFHAAAKAVRIDMSKAWREQAASVRRGLALYQDKTLVIQDEIMDPRGLIEWNLVTFDDIRVEGNAAVIHHEDQQCFVKIHEPQDAVFVVKSLKPDNDVENQNEGFARLGIDIPAQAGKTRIRVQLSTDHAGTEQAADLPDALEDWPECQQ